jgi:hypothetical protein
MLAMSGITPPVIAARGCRTVTKRSELEQPGFSRPQRIIATLPVPIWSSAGTIGSYQHRPDAPRINGAGKPIKYETPVASRMVIDVPPPTGARLGNPSIPLLVTEGVKKAESAVSRGLYCIAVLGVWNWRGRNEDGCLTALADWESIALNDHPVLSSSTPM